MQKCSLQYIPSRLQKKNKPIIEQFEVGECLYMRCKPEVLNNPYKDISITELSHNRSGLSNNILCNPDDVLYSIKENEAFEKYFDMEVCTLEIISLNETEKYKKSFTETKNGNDLTSILEILHEPEPCMYPHSVFRVWLNDEKVTYDNYKTTLKKAHKIRNSIKEELASMIRRRQVSQEDYPI
jgi:hypothetical protein